MKTPITIFFLIILFINISCAEKSTEVLNNPNKTKFMFLINSDPQMGDEHTKKMGLQTLNELLQMFVDETNARKGKEKVDFVVWDGDLVWKPLQNAFDNFQRIVSKMKIPSVLVHGNHDGINDDPKFENLQYQLSGYKKLNYSFDYGKWHFVVISAQEKYLKDREKKNILQWLDNDLYKHKNKQIMLFMHYHIIPAGLSQLEFYTYSPIGFKNKMLDTITAYNNVKYVFSGHVHIGVKASIKTARIYKGTKFIIVPTPVFARPFGEEFPKFRQKEGLFNRKGFYLEVHVNGDKVKLVGRKIKHQFSVVYPSFIQEFKESDDLRNFIPEGKLPIYEKLVNGDFKNKLRGWSSSLRYKKDKNPSFINYVKNGVNTIEYNATYGSWSFEQYLENYQIVKYKNNMQMEMSYMTTQGKVKGGGGYIRIFAYDISGKLLKILLFHWGNQEQKVKFMQQSWAFNSTGDRLDPLWLDKMISNGDMISFTLPENYKLKQKINIDIGRLLEKISKDDDTLKDLNHIGLGYGVWARTNKTGKKFSSGLHVSEIKITSNNLTNKQSLVQLNSDKILKTDKELFYGYVFKKPAHKTQ